MTDPAITPALAIPALGSNPHPTKGTPPMNLNDITLTAEIPLDANLDNRTTIGYDSDGDPIYPSGPVTVVDAVIAAAAESLAAGLMREFSNRQGGYRSGVSDLYDEKLKERVESIIDAKVEEQFAAMRGGRPATAFSEAVPAKTLDEYVGERVQTWLNQATGDSYSRDRKSRLEQALTKLLDREQTKALDDTIADARRKALDAVAGVAQDKLAEALRQSISQIAKG